jgi:hypothetical protein
MEYAGICSITGKPRHIRYHAVRHWISSLRKIGCGRDDLMSNGAGEMN